LQSDDRTQDGAGAGDGLELVAEQDVSASGHEFDSIHIHGGRRGPFGVRFDDFGIDALGIEAIAEDGHRKSQQNDNHRVHISLPSFALNKAPKAGPFTLITPYYLENIHFEYVSSMAAVGANFNKED
jgi:hypothetical protein